VRPWGELPRRRGAWFYSSDSAYRFMALMSGHPPTYRAWKQVYTFTSGTVDSDRDSLPGTAAEWKLGEPHSYLIDVLDDRTRLPVFRVYFQDAPSEPPLGFRQPKYLLSVRSISRCCAPRLLPTFQIRPIACSSF
jgi:hypothetical protein